MNHPHTPSVSFQIEKIIGVSKGSGNVHTYQVQWAPCWVSGIHLVGCEKLIKEFLQSYSVDQEGFNEKVENIQIVHQNSPSHHPDDENDNLDDDNCMLENEANRYFEIADNDAEKDHPNQTMDGEYFTDNRETDESYFYDDQNDLVEKNVIVEKNRLMPHDEVNLTSVGTHKNNTNINKDHHDSVEKYSPIQMKVEETSTSDDLEPRNPAKFSENYMDGYHKDVVDNKDRINRQKIWSLERSLALQEEPYDNAVNTMLGGREVSIRDKPRVMDNKHKLLPPLYLHKSTPSQDKTFECKNCEHIFYNEVNFMSHSCLTCPICGKTFNKKYDFKRHCRIHSGERPYSCAMCLKAFTRRHDLTRHIRTHTGEKPYNCEKCGKDFKRKESLIYHDRTFHDTVPEMNSCVSISQAL